MEAVSFYVKEMLRDSTLRRLFIGSDTYSMISSFEVRRKSYEYERD